MAGNSARYGAPRDLDRVGNLKMRRQGDALCFSESGLVTWGQFAADVAELRPRIAAASHVCNALSDRFDFKVGLAAAMLNGQTTVLPNAAAFEAVGGALDGADMPLILGGAPQHDDLGWRIADIGSSEASIDPSEMVRELEASSTPIHVFTSGTTKRPQRHLKNWKTLSGGAEITAALLQRMGATPARSALLGTTPHQHMYGLEATVFGALSFGFCTHRGNLFFPADLEDIVVTARKHGIEELILISSPAHLKFLEAALLEAPLIKGIISATAPLPKAQAARLEARGDLPVMEIYGSSETGSLAVRRTIEGPLWEPLAGFSLEQSDTGSIARAPHLAEPTPLGDVIEMSPDGRFALLGRVGDMVSINGKRSSLGTLSAVLTEVPELLDGVVLHQPDDGEDLLVIVAVRDPAAGLSEAETKTAIRRHFYRHLDPVFAARRIVFADRLPRSGTGKIAAAEYGGLFQMAGLQAPVMPS